MFYFWVVFLSILIFGKLYRNEIKTTKMNRKENLQISTTEKERRILEWGKGGKWSLVKCVKLLGIKPREQNKTLLFKKLHNLQIYH